MEFTGKKITGKQFNELNTDTSLYKLTNNEENHHGYQYTNGLNIDTNVFDISNLVKKENTDEKY